MKIKVYRQSFSWHIFIPNLLRFLALGNNFNSKKCRLVKKNVEIYKQFDDNLINHKSFQKINYNQLT